MTLAELIARKAARTAAGVPSKFYIEHARPKPAADGSGSVSPARARSLSVVNACEHLGDLLPGEPCGSQVRHCKLHDCTTTRFVKCAGAARHCETCTDNTTRRTGPHPNVARAGEFARAIPPYPEGRYSGRGVVVV